MMYEVLLSWLNWMIDGSSQKQMGAQWLVREDTVDRKATTTTNNNKKHFPSTFSLVFARWMTIDTVDRRRWIRTILYGSQYYLDLSTPQGMSSTVLVLVHSIASIIYYSSTELSVLVFVVVLHEHHTSSTIFVCGAMFARTVGSIFRVGWSLQSSSRVKYCRR